eukprot:CAMPEP_0168537512 /NCGR_PEP_ID=MMETSP0405-20121227/20404_1 /TAXON_ID=498012 /ORGANISM="Trichosphaerium sp, Strain Am-I-7 wt" /LENGTH=115 /DNA_ID=CAMNT_0008566153 /DNA_START=44 /DNA_END=388 /DNA_ORIENTATION=+
MTVIIDTTTEMSELQLAAIGAVIFRGPEHIFFSNITLFGTGTRSQIASDGRIHFAESLDGTFTTEAGGIIFYDKPPTGVTITGAGSIAIDSGVMDWGANSIATTVAHIANGGDLV